MGTIYFYGIGVKRDLRAAFDNFATGAKSGCKSCYEMLGAMYEFGMGVKRDKAKARANTIRARN